MHITTTRLRTSHNHYCLVTSAGHPGVPTKVVYQEYRILNHLTGATRLDYECSFEGPDAEGNAAAFMGKRERMAKAEPPLTAEEIDQYDAACNTMRGPNDDEFDNRNWLSEEAAK